MSAILAIASLVASLVALDVAAVLWGADSREDLESAEWERRQNWKGYRR